MPRLPQASGEALVRLLLSLGYRVVRQRGSHVQLVLTTPAGPHRITVPMHRSIAKGTLSDILSAVSSRVGIPRDELIQRLT
jgi:predicted RNA binding protein YcfA (HicA-like mRNA interferase family)